MVNSVPQAYYQEYLAEVQTLSQQKFSVFENLMTTGTTPGNIGERVYWDRVNAISFSAQTTPNEATPYIDVEHSKRSATFNNYAVYMYVDPFIDLTKMQFDPTNTYVQLGVAAWKRKIDEIAIAAALGTATDGKDAGTSTAFPTATQTVDLAFKEGDPIGAGNGTSTDTFATGDTLLTIAKIKKAYSLLHTNFSTNPGDRINLVVSPEEEISLLGMQEYTNRDYKSELPYDMSTFVGGAYIGHMLGIDIYRSTLLTVTDPAGASNQYRSCLMFPTSGLGKYIGKELSVEMAKNPARSFAWTIGLQAGMGASRIEEVKMIEIRTATGTDAS